MTNKRMIMAALLGPSWGSEKQCHSGTTRTGRTRNDVEKLSAGLGDRPKILGLEARAANERALDPGERQEIAGILRIDRAAIKNAGPSGNRSADHLMDGGYIGEGRRQAGADRPDRFIGDDEFVGRGTVRQRAGKLAGTDRCLPARLAFRPRFADAENRDKAGPPCGGNLGAHIGVALAVAVAPLGMADDDVGAAGVLQHLGADVTGKGAFFGKVAILAAERHAA